MTNDTKQFIKHLTEDQKTDAHVQLIKQADAINEALTIQYNADDENNSHATSGIIIRMNDGTEHALGLWHVDVIHMLGNMLDNVISFAKQEIINPPTTEKSGELLAKVLDCIKGHTNCAEASAPNTIEEDVYSIVVDAVEPGCTAEDMAQAVVNLVELFITTPPIYR